MPRPKADIWLRRKGGRPDSWYFKRKRLGTKDANEARRLVKLLTAAEPPPRDPADVANEAFTAGGGGARPADGQGNPGVGSAPSYAPEGSAGDVPGGGAQAPSPTQSGDWAGEAAAAAGGGTAAAAPTAPTEIDSDAVANVMVALQVEGAAMWARQKVWEGFATPALPEPMAEGLTRNWKTIIEYSGTAVQLPPWVMGALVPGVGLVISTVALAKMFAAEAQRQRAAAGGAGGT